LEAIEAIAQLCVEKRGVFPCGRDIMRLSRPRATLQSEVAPAGGRAILATFVQKVLRALLRAKLHGALRMRCITTGTLGILNSECLHNAILLAAGAAFAHTLMGARGSDLRSVDALTHNVFTNLLFICAFVTGVLRTHPRTVHAEAIIAAVPVSFDFTV